MKTENKTVILRESTKFDPLPKPTYLADAATTFSEIFKGNYSSPGIIEKLADCNNFLMQSFDMRMIDLYFTYDGQFSFESWYAHGRRKCMVYKIKQSKPALGKPYAILTAPLPPTLQDFISDCIRAGIKLKWK